MSYRKIIAVSDIHGHYKELIETLTGCGFDFSPNSTDLLVVCGDMFDRGSESLAVYELLKKMYDDKKTIIIRGNHENMLIDYLDGTCISPFNYLHNGMDETFAEFLHCTKPFETWCVLKGKENPTYGDFAEWIKVAIKSINEEYPELLPWLKSLPYYLETNDYIFTHGAIDTEAENWREPHCTKFGKTDWEALVWDDGSFFGKDVRNTDGKVVVIGHFGTNHLRQMYNLVDIGDKPNYNTLTNEEGNIIALDSTVVVSHKINSYYCGMEYVKEDEIWN